MRLEGQRLGRYTLSQLIGSGGMGEVYLAIDPRIEQQVAIKVVKSEIPPYPNRESAGNEATSLFLREAKAIARLDHPNILPLFDYGEEQIGEINITYIVMPYRKEGSLVNWLRQHYSSSLPSPKDIASFIYQASSALQHAHEHQLIHQDVKPSNFLLRQRNENPSHPDLLLADFGIAKFYSASVSASMTIRGTPSYMAPEQWQGRPVFATDQYALAVMTYQLLTARPPFHGNIEQIMYSHFHEQAIPPSAINPRVSSAVDAVIMQALAKKAEDRFPSVFAFNAAFQQAWQRADKLSSSINPHPSEQVRSSVSYVQPPSMKPSDPDIRLTLAISPQEALNGTVRVLTLPGGQILQVPVQAGAYNGQTLYLERRDESAGAETINRLAVTLNIISNTDFAPLLNDGSDDKTYISSSNEEGLDARKLQVGSNPNIESAIPGAGGVRQSAISPPTPPITPQSLFPTVHAVQSHRRRISKPMVGILLILAFIIIAGSISTIFYINTTNQARSHLNSTATVSAATSIAATATASWFPYPPNTGKLVLNDPLSENSKATNWLPGFPSNAGERCFFSNKEYDIFEPVAGNYYYCVAGNTNYTNFALQVNVTFLQGNLGSYGGLFFRSKNQDHYYFRIGRDGTYWLATTTNDLNFKILKKGTSSAIITGFNRVNIMAVVVNRNVISLYINQSFVFSTTDTTFSNGQIALVADYDYNVGNGNYPVEVAFSDIKVWTL